MRWAAAMFVVLCGALACSPSGAQVKPATPAAPAVSEPAPPLSDLRAARAEMAAAFADQAALCTARQDTAHPAFHGCIDWHSAAHGTWALAAYQRYTGDTRHAAQLNSLLDPEKLAEELDYVRARPDFEMPYGRAWFLRLHHDWKGLGGDGRLDALAALSGETLLARYEAQAPNPRADRYGSDSWALINLRLYGETIGDDAIVARVDELVRTHFMAPGARCERALEERGFIAICVNWAWLVSQSVDEAAFRAWYEDWNPGLETLVPVTQIRNAHDYGRNFSRAWGLSALADATGDARLRESYGAHLHAGYTPDSRWKGDYLANGHWVAQFGTLALAPLFAE